MVRNECRPAVMFVLRAALLLGATMMFACSGEPSIATNGTRTLNPGTDTGIVADDVGAGNADATGPEDVAFEDSAPDLVEPPDTVLDVERDADDDAQDEPDLDARSDTASGDTGADARDEDVLTDVGASDVADGGADVEVPQLPVLELRGPAEPVVAGDTFTVRCAALLDGMPTSGVPTTIETATSAVAVQQEDGTWRALSPGTAIFGCRDARRILADAPPLNVQVLAGAPTRLRATVSATEVVAGESLIVRCTGEDALGLELGEIDSRVLARVPGGEVAVVGASSVGESTVPLRLDRSVPHRVSCLLDGVPESDAVDVSVSPASAVRVRVVPSVLELRAGEWGAASCVGEDRYGNVIGVLDEANLYVVPSPLVTRVAQVEPGAVRAFEVVGNPYEVRCEGEGLQSTNAALVTIRPDSASRLIGEFLANGQRIDGRPPRVPPGSFVYGNYRVYDRYNNQIETRGLDSQIVTSIAPAAPRLSSGWLLEEPGQYEFTVQWRGPSSADVRDVVYTLNVDSGGPLLTCVSPADAEWLVASPGSAYTVTVAAQDDVGVDEVEVNGQLALPIGGGLYETELVLLPGINLLDVRATDTLGQDGAVACAFLAAREYAPIDAPIDDGLRIILGADAFDDGSRRGAVNSMADLVAAALTSDVVVDELDAALDSVNPLWSGSVPTPLGSVGGRVEYRGGVSIGSSSSASISMSGSRLRIPLTLRDVRVPVRVVVTGVFGATDTGTVTASSVSTTASVSLRRSGTRLVGTLESLGAVNIAGLDGSFGSSITNTGWDLAEPTVRAELEDQLSGALEPALSDLVAEVFQAFGTFETSLQLVAPAIDDGPSVPVLFEYTLASVVLSAPTLTLGLDGRFVVPPAEVIRDEAMVPLLDEQASLPVVDGVGVYVSLDFINQGLIALWSAGLFDTTLFDFGSVVDVVPGTEITTFTIRPDLPPVASVRDGQLVLSFGSVYSDLLDYFYGAGVLDSRVGADVAATPVLNADGSLGFEDVRVVRSIVSLQPANYTRSDYDRVLDGLINARIETVAAEAMAAALPDTAFPTIEGSTALAPFGLPGGESLTLIDPSVTLLEHGVLFVGELGSVE